MWSSNASSGRHVIMKRYFYTRIYRGMSDKHCCYPRIGYSGWQFRAPTAYSPEKLPQHYRQQMKIGRIRPMLLGHLNRMSFKSSCLNDGLFTVKFFQLESGRLIPPFYSRINYFWTHISLSYPSGMISLGD